MYKSKEIILPVMVLILLTVVPIWMIVSYWEKYSYYKDLSENGVMAGARLVNKEIKIDKNKLLRLFIVDNKENYRFAVGFKNKSSEYVRCEFGVSKDTYYSIGIRDELAVVYPPSSPAKCTLPDGVEISRNLILATLIMAVFIFILAIGFSYYVYKSYKKPDPDKLIKPTTDMDLDGAVPKCPKCTAVMSQGYLPTVGGVAWRDKDEPIGIPTMFTGLPGTTFWIKRPLLDAYHCKPCEIITFKYGRSSVS